MRATQDSRGRVTDDPEILAAIWHETRGVRASIHQIVARPCDTRMGGSGAGPFRVDGECPCRDFVIDMIAAGQAFVDGHGGALRNPAGAVRVHIRTRAAGDWIRRRRVAMGAQARSDRIRAGARGRGLPSEFHRAVLQFAVDEAGSPAALDDDAHLHRRIAVRCAAEFGGTADEHLAPVASAYAVVAEHCRTGPLVNAGTAAEPEHVTWWERYVERPLGRRPRRTLQVDPAEVVLLARAGPEIDVAALGVLVEAARRSPDDAVAAVRGGTRDLVRAGLLPEPSASSLLADESRLNAAARELIVLVHRCGP